MMWCASPHTRWQRAFTAANAAPTFKKYLRGGQIFSCQRLGHERLRMRYPKFHYG
jgi:hypothetical protein